jgi:alkylation response protein AidB-like acyl-CoA dehydrogenase
MTVPSIYAGGERNGEAILASTDCRAALVATAKEESTMDTHLVFENVRELSARFATERPARQQRRELAAADFAQLREAGFPLAGVPIDHGGIWESVRRSTRPLCELLRTLAHGDSSVALVCAMHPTVLVFWLAHAQVPAPFQAA